MDDRRQKLDSCWEYSVTLVKNHGRVLETLIGQGHIMTLTYADGHKLIIDEHCSEVPVSVNIYRSAAGNYAIDIDSDNDTETATFKVTKDNQGTTLFTVNEDGSISFNNGLSVSATGDVSLGFGDLVSEQNPDGADAIRIKGTDCIDVVIGGMTGLFAIWNVADNTPVFYVNERGDISITGSVDMNSHKINELTDPALDQDAATKKYVDDADAAYTRHDLATAASDFLVASGAGVFVKKTLAEAKAILLPSYDTGWISRSDWTNVHMGSNVAKDVDSELTHGLNAPLSDLLVKVLISTDGTDNNSFEVEGVITIPGVVRYYGYNIDQVDSDGILIQTGEHGITYLDVAGEQVSIAAQDWYYKIKVYKLG